MAAIQESKQFRGPNSWRWLFWQRKPATLVHTSSRWTRSTSSQPWHAQLEQCADQTETCGYGSSMLGERSLIATCVSRAFGRTTISWPSDALRSSTCEATRSRTRWQAGRQQEWKCFPVRQAPSKELTAWLGRSGRESLRRTLLRSRTSPSATSCRRVHQITGRQDSRGDVSCSPTLLPWGTPSRGSGADETSTTARSVAVAAASESGGWIPRVAQRYWPDMTPAGWR